MLIHSKGGQTGVGMGSTRIVIPISGTIRWISLDQSWYSSDGAIQMYFGYGALSVSQSPQYQSNTTGVGQDGNVILGLKFRTHQLGATNTYNGASAIVLPDAKFRVTRGQDLWNIAYASHATVSLDVDICFLIE